MSSVKFQWPAACAGWGRQEALQIEAAAQQYGDARAAEAEAQKDAAYEERNRVVALLAALLPSVRTRTAIEGWSEDWHGCVYITLPDGSQASWHFHDSQAHLFAHVPEGQATWDGHTTPEKYTRIERCTAARPNIAAAPQPHHQGILNSSQPAVQPEPPPFSLRARCPSCRTEFLTAGIDPPDLHPQPQLDRAAAEKPKPASVTPLNPAAAWPFPSTYRKPRAMTSHFTRAQLDAMVEAAKEANRRRAELMPTEQNAVRALFEAWYRLKQLGWEDATYAPAGVDLLLIECGSTGIHRGTREAGDGLIPGAFWIYDHGDACPSLPTLFKRAE